MNEVYWGAGWVINPPLYDSTGKIPLDKIGIGTPDATKALHGDGTWKVPAGGGGGGAVWRAGAGPPDPTLGNVGDFYLDTVTGDVYRKD